jgi:hypothetical protein
MRNQLTLYAIIFITTTYSQIQKKTITGKVLFEKSGIANTHIINQKTNQGSNTNNFGVFQISASIGDTLKFSHINHSEKKIVITKENIITDTLKINLILKIYQLKEITLEKPKDSIDSTTQNLPPEINATTLNLPYAGTKVKKNHSVLRIRAGLVFSINNFINFLKGDHKRRKQLKKITLEDNSIADIRNHFTDKFFISVLSIKSENINVFLNYCYPKNIVKYFNNKDYVTLKVILVKESISFLKEINTLD